MTDPQEELEAKQLWRELESAGQPVRVRPSRQLRLMAAAGLAPGSLRLTMPSGVAYDYLREDIHHQLQDQAVLRAQDAAAWRIRILAAVERAARSGRLFDCGLCGTLGALLGMAIAALLTWGLR